VVVLIDYLHNIITNILYYPGVAIYTYYIIKLNKSLSKKWHTSYNKIKPTKNNYPIVIHNYWKIIDFRFKLQKLKETYYKKIQRETSPQLTSIIAEVSWSIWFFFNFNFITLYSVQNQCWQAHRVNRSPYIKIRII
jgi:hypothetical protein